MKRRIERAGNRYLMLNKEIRLEDEMKLLPDDEIVIIFRDTDEVWDPEQAIFNGEVRDYWKEKSEEALAQRVTKKVVRMETRYLEDTVGAVIMITVR